MCGYIFLYWSVCSVCRRQHREMLCTLWCGQRSLSGEYGKSSKLEKFHPVSFVSLLFQVRPQQGPGIGEGALFSEQKGGEQRQVCHRCVLDHQPPCLPVHVVVTSSWSLLLHMAHCSPGSAHICCVLTHHVLFYLWFFMPLLFFKLPFLFLMTPLP